MNDRIRWPASATAPGVDDRTGVRLAVNSFQLACLHKWSTVRATSEQSQRNWLSSKSMTDDVHSQYHAVVSIKYCGITQISTSGEIAYS